MFKHILVPIDGSETGHALMQRACTFAKETGARVTFYHAQPAYFPVMMAGEGMMADASAYEDFRKIMSTRARTVLDQAVRVATEVGVECDTLSSESDSPYEGIIAAAKERGCDLIFMSSHGRRGAKAFLLGSETQKVLTHCSIPVLVYR